MSAPKPLSALQTKLAAMPRADLELFAQNVVTCLYVELDEETDELVLNSGKERDADTLEAIVDDVENSGLNPEKL